MRIPHANVDFLSTTLCYIRFTVTDETGKISNMPIRVIDTDVQARWWLGLTMAFPSSR